MQSDRSRTDNSGAFIKVDNRPGNIAVLPGLKAFAGKYLMLLSLSWRGFNADMCPLRAAALTLYTLLSIVPVFAMLFGVAKGFGIDALLRERLLQQFRDQQEIAYKLIDFSQALLANTQGGVVAGVGIALLFWSVMGVIGEIEKSFNHIWKIGSERVLARKIGDYLSLMLLAPVLLTASSSIAVYAQSRVNGFATATDLPEYGSELLLSLFGYLPLLIVWLVFSFTLIFMPNTKVDVRSGVLAGILSGTAYQLTQWLYLRLQIGVSGYNAIYGSFAALPLFIVWLQAGWLILLFGAELAFYHQYFKRYRIKGETIGSFALKKRAALRIAHLLVHKFAAAEPPLTAEEIAQALHLPLADVQAVIEELLKTRILAQVQGGAADVAAYQPARDIGLLRIATIVEALENACAGDCRKTGVNDCFTEITAQFAEIVRNAPENRLLKDI